MAIDNTKTAAPAVSTPSVEPTTPPDMATLFVSKTSGPAYKPGKMYNLDPKMLHIPTTHTRSDIDAGIEELAVSVRQHGIIQPVAFYLDSTDKPLVCAGARRTMAAIKAECKTIPCIYMGTDADPRTISLLENIQRTDLAPIQLAEGLKNLKNDNKYTVTTLASIIGKSKSTVSEILLISELPLEMRDKHRNNHDLPLRKLLELAKVANDPSKLQPLYNRLINNASRDELRAARTGGKPVSQNISKWVETGLKKIVVTSFKDVDDDKKPEIAAKLKELIAQLAVKLTELGS